MPLVFVPVVALAVFTLGMHTWIFIDKKMKKEKQG